MDAVVTSSENEVFTITLNRPEKKNAMDMELLQGLYDALKKAEAAKRPVIILRGAGKAFCSGGDIIAFKKADDPEGLIDAEAAILNESIKLIRSIGSIVVAVVEGVAVGAGMGLSLACDLTIATEKTIMNLGYRRIGLTPDGGASILLSRIIGAKRFNELYLFSRNITMTEAKELGLVNVVVGEDSLDRTVTEMIRDLVALPLETIRYFKDLVNASLFQGLESHLEKERVYVSYLGSKPIFKQRIEELLRRK